MSEGASTDSLPVNLAQEYRVKLGKTFTFPQQNAYHTLKYDFKPLSVDSSRPGRLKITEEDTVNVSLPIGQDESVEGYAQFRGPKKNCTKECILIIDRVTGEAKLERISDTVQLKAIRDGRKPMVNRDRSISPSPYLTQTKTPPIKSSFKSTSSTHLTPQTNKPPQQGGSNPPSSSTKIPKITQKAPKVSKHQLAPPSRGGGSSGTKNEKKAKSKLVKSHSQPIKPSSSSHSRPGSSLSNIGYNPQPKSIAMDDIMMDLQSSGQEISPIQSTNPTPEPIKVGTLSSESSSSSSSSSESSSSENESMEEQTPVSTVKTVTSVFTEASKGSGERSSMQSSQLLTSQRPNSSLGSVSISRTSSGGKTGHRSLQFMDQRSMELLGRASQPSSHRPANQPSRLTDHSTELQSFVRPAGHGTDQRPIGHRMDPQSVGHSVGHGNDKHSLGHPVGHPLGHPVGHPDSRPSSKSMSQVAQSRKRKSRTSSSSSGSDSSSGSFSSDSSSDSDEENDREVADVFSHPLEPARHTSISLLRSDLNLSESGSDSD